MLVICICYFARFVYDLVLLLVLDWFRDMRNASAEQQDGHRIYYSVFLFCLLFGVEFCPIAMFTVNLKFVFNHQAECIPKLTPRKSKCSDEEEARMPQKNSFGATALFKKPEIYRESLLSESD